MWERYKNFQWFSNGCKSTNLNTERTKKMNRFHYFSIVVHKVSQWGGNTLSRILNKVHSGDNTVQISRVQIQGFDGRQAQRSGGGVLYVYPKELCH